MGAMDALVRGVRMAYDDEGAGPVVVRLHGLTGSRASDDATGAFDADGLVRAGRRAVRFDARGHGRSGGEKVESDYAWPNLARDLLALLDELEVEEAVSGVGASMGTATLLHAVTLSPDRFDRLVLLPTVMRGAASSDLPPPEAISEIRKPTLILAWDGDPGHPVATAERLHELIPGSALHVARTPEEVRTWSDRTVGFLH